MEWISAKDKLPEYVAIDTYTIPPWVLIKICVEPFLLEGKTFGRFQDGNWYIYPEYFTAWDKHTPVEEHIVTHWMPLP